MNNDLQQFSEERLKKISSSAFYYAGCEINEIQALARIALSVKQAKAIGYVESKTTGTDRFILKGFYEQDINIGGRLYTTPQPAHTEQVITLDYLQGHADGLEWAARTAEACNPFTSDWLYDEPEALAAAIRKGPEMPPVPPVSSPVIPGGWKLIPIEPTEDMRESYYEHSLAPISRLSVTGYRALIAAAPKPESE